MTPMPPIPPTDRSRVHCLLLVICLALLAMVVGVVWALLWVAKTWF